MLAPADALSLAVERGAKPERRHVVAPSVQDHGDVSEFDESGIGRETLLLTIIEGRSSWPALGSHSTPSPPSIIHSIGQLRLRLQEVFMQIYGDKLSNEDRPVARRWTFGALGLYGTILVLMILYAELGPKPDASLASGEARAIAESW